MSWSRSAAIMRHEIRIMRADAAGLATLVVMPVVMIAFFKPLARLALVDDNPQANGSEYTVPAMATMFAFFLVASIGFAFISERQWSTWDRLMASPATHLEVLAGKVVPAFGLTMLQQAALFTFGFVGFGLRPKGPILAIALVVLAFCVCLTSLGVLLASVFKSNQQLNAVSNVGTMVLSGISGAFVPLDVLPGWARTIAPISPQYWALRGYRSVILEGGGLDVVALPIAVLLVFTVIGAVLSLLRLRFDETTVRVSAAAAAPAAA